MAKSLERPLEHYLAKSDINELSVQILSNKPSGQGVYPSKTSETLSQEHFQRIKNSWASFRWKTLNLNSWGRLISTYLEVTLNWFEEFH